MMTPEQLTEARAMGPHIRRNPPAGIVLVRDVPDPGPGERWRYVWRWEDDAAGEGMWVSEAGDEVYIPSDPGSGSGVDGLLCITHDGIPDLTDPITAMWVAQDEDLILAMATDRIRGLVLGPWELVSRGMAGRQTWGRSTPNAPDECVAVVSGQPAAMFGSDGAPLMKAEWKVSDPESGSDVDLVFDRAHTIADAKAAADAWLVAHGAVLEDAP